MIEEQILFWWDNLDVDYQSELMTKHCPGINLSDVKPYQIEKIYNCIFNPEGVE